MTWKIDKAHSKVAFHVRHMMISKVHGEFTDFDVQLSLDPKNLGNAKISATIDADSVETGQPKRDEHLKSADFFDTDEFPAIKFESTSFQKSGGDNVELKGNLTIHGITKPITLKGEQLGPVKNPLTDTKSVGYSLTGELNREDYDLTWNKAMESGGVLVGKTINVAIEAEVVEAD